MLNVTMYTLLGISRRCATRRLLESLFVGRLFEHKHLFDPRRDFFGRLVQIVHANLLRRNHAAVLVLSHLTHGSNHVLVGNADP